MIWGLGTGRCGTKSLAVQLGGVHEPPDGIGSLLVERWGLGATKENQTALVAKLKDRMVKYCGKPIVDPRHSYMIPEIKMADPRAKFLWMYRDPVLCIESWLARGSWSERDKLGGRYHPRGGYPKGWTRVQKGIWFWRSVNNLIRENLLERFQVLRCPTDLEVHENENTDATWANDVAYKLTEDDRRLVSLGCGFLMDGLSRLRLMTREEVL